jgi:hypothetical protein
MFAAPGCARENRRASIDSHQVLFYRLGQASGKSSAVFSWENARRLGVCISTPPSYRMTQPPIISQNMVSSIEYPPYEE